MRKNLLGKTGIEVTELCFGALPMGPLQKNLPVEECTKLLVAAMEGGVNFIDTAQMYKTYEPIRRALKQVKDRPVISSKSAAKSYEDMQKAVDEALEAMGVDYIDIFNLHAARADANVFEERRGALQCLIDNKAKGRIRAVGISTHSVAVTRLAADKKEIDIVFPIINIKGAGILEGTRDEMKDAISECALKGKGVFLMKVLGGGSIIEDYHKAIAYARTIPGYASMAIGMVSLEEVEYNLRYFSGDDINPDSLPTIKGFKKQFVAVPSLCKNCGTCITACPNSAITEKDSIAFIQQDRCLQCGYCVGACPQFAIRII